MLKQRIYRRCAIVGNSGLSMIYDDGPRIDAHDAVMRFNSAPTRPRKSVVVPSATVPLPTLRFESKRRLRQQAKRKQQRRRRSNSRKKPASRPLTTKGHVRGDAVVGRRGRDADATARDVVANFPLHVGNRTTFRFINTQHIQWFEGNEVRLQQLQSKTGLFRYLQHKKEHPEARLHAFDTDFTKYVSQNIVNLPTGGYFAVRPI